ncbi:MAG: 3-oxoacid CoA-transferase subunit A [Dehalococcoidia bacterium]|nr:3-oxoacid CoA-transferase subunit A [Dehalococcoidia bacterium]
MPLDKVVAGLDAAVRDIADGAVLLLGGFAGVGVPSHLIMAVLEKGAKDLTIVCNDCNGGTRGDRLDAAMLVDFRRVRKAITSYPVVTTTVKSCSFELQYRRREVDLELTPQGSLAERLRAAGAGIPAFYTPTGIGTRFAEGKETRVFDGRPCVMERALKADFALIRAWKADRYGNLVYRRAARNFNPVMAPAARTTIAEVDEVVEPGELDPEAVVTPGIFVHRVVRVTEADRRRLAMLGEKVVALRRSTGQ